MGLKVEHLVKKYGSFTAVQDLDFEISKPGVFALLGTNGAGKTTAIRSILGMLSKEGGEVTWNGKPLDVTNEKIGYLAEERGLYPKYNILEQMYYFASLKNMKRADATKAIDYWFNRLEINEYKTKRAEQLSKGNQQKVQLAAALICSPELLVLDEPLSGLDPVNSDLFKSVIREQIGRNIYIIMSSHQMSTIEEFCSDLVMLHKGQVVLKGDLNEIKKGYGRVNLTVKADKDFMPLAEECGLAVTNQTPNGTSFHVSKEEDAHIFLRKMIAAEIPVVKFELREPTLHEIFVEKAGGSIDEN